jgi:hypothetical protein
MTDDPRGDADLRGDILKALMLGTLVPDTSDARVNDGEIAMTRPPPAARDAKDAITKAGQAASGEANEARRDRGGPQFVRVAVRRGSIRGRTMDHRPRRAAPTG